MKHQHRWTRWVSAEQALVHGWQASPFCKWTRRCTAGGCGSIQSSMTDPQ